MAQGELSEAEKVDRLFALSASHQRYASNEFGADSKLMLRLAILYGQEAQERKIKLEISDKSAHK